MIAKVKKCFEVLLIIMINNKNNDQNKNLKKNISAFHPYEVDKMSTRNFWEPNGKK